MISVITEDHTLLYSSLTMSLDYSMYLQPLIAFSLTTLKEQNLGELSWESEEYRCCLQQVEAGKLESYKLYVLFVAPRTCPAAEASFRCRILFGVIRTVLGPYDFIYEGIHSPIQRLSQSIPVLNAVIRRVNCLLKWEPSLYWPLPLALPTIRCTLMQTGVLFSSLSTILTEAHKNVTDQMYTSSTKADCSDLRATIISSTRLAAFLDAHLLDITSCEPPPKGLLPRDYLSHSNYISMLVHSTLYTKLHSILTDKWGDSPEFPRTVTSQKDTGCILDKFIGSLEEQDPSTTEASEYFSRSYHVMNLTCQGNEVTSIVVQQTLDSYGDHTTENLRVPVFTLFYCVLMTSNLVQQLEQRYHNNLETFAAVIHETLHSTCFQLARKLFPAMFPPLYIQVCHPLKALTSHYLHAVTHNKCLAFIASNHTFKETLTHSVYGLLEEASCFLPSPKSQRSHNSMNSEDEHSLNTQVHQLKTGVEATRIAFTSMFCFRHNCMGAGLRFSIQKKEDKIIVFWMTYIHIHDQMSGISVIGKAKTKVPKANSIPWEVIDHTIPGTQMASCFSVLKIPLHRTVIQSMCAGGTYSVTDGHFGAAQSSDRLELLVTGVSRRASFESTPKRSTSASKNSIKASQHSSGIGQSRAGSNRRSLLGSAFRKTPSLISNVSLDTPSPSQAPEVTKWCEAHYQSAHLIDMVAVFTSDTSLDEATSYMVQILDKIVQNRYAKGMFL
ncbi:Hypothetical protein GLP15_3553 [Giardia lamblia P15]|uniref:Uncharacterized protein n=1 Tax=Giardia intestinalis (strain P15) TaxID=658858 RepID=E1F7J0_GIAIA|nr:Hypothetical protein GLP15_3553 [Giardia lamblia P15]